LGSVLSILVLVAGGAFFWFYAQLRSSLPQLDGADALAGLSAQVTVTRDALGVPTIKAATRTDVARALGYLHAQDRFFQMDLLRRRGAGELAELFGKVALPLDRSTRRHGFRALAQKVFAGLNPAERTFLTSYTAGVNAGLAALKKKPFEYLVLRQEPAPWLPEDSLLIIYAMTLDLQGSGATYELSLATLRDRLGTAGVAFFAPLVRPDDAALDGSTAPLAPIPPASVIDLRVPAKTARTAVPPPDSSFFATTTPREADLSPGSNSFALSGAHTATGVALLANDPHLDLNVPNIWYRASLEWREPVAGHLIGVTLPGLPFLVIGSNGHIAWGLTDAYADTGDFVTIDVNAIDHSLYRIPGRTDLLEIEKRADTIRVKGADPVKIETPWTAWGPIIATDGQGRPLAYHWTAHDPAATNLEFLHLESAQTVAEAVAIAHRSGIPAQNFNVADSTGSIAWTIIGRLPKRVGFDGRLPTSWSYGDRRWQGFLPPDEVPTILPASGRLWSANNRTVGGAALTLIGDGGYATPPRAAQIRDDLAALEKAGPQDMLGIQLDDRALFLERWQKLLLTVLTPEVVAAKPARAELRRLAQNWGASANIDSAGYRLVRAFRTHTTQLTLSPILAGCEEQMPGFDWSRFHTEPAVWTILHEKPAHLLNPKYSSWAALLLAAADAVIADLDQQGIPLAQATWGRRNTAQIKHPFGRMLPAWLGSWLNMPADPLAGDANMPRIQTPSFGASMRYSVSPGRETEGLFQMSGGQSGHPLSPFYRAGHSNWVKGKPGPLLPGPTTHTLILTP